MQEKMKDKSQGQKIYQKGDTEIRRKIQPRKYDQFRFG